MKYVPLWLIAGSLVFFVLVVWFGLLVTIGYYVVVRPALQEQERRELIRREPWREFDR